jgi:RNA polymerase sigma-70 factor (ECF subfamily)
VDERSLISRAVRGDAAAERTLYDAHVDRIYRLAFRLTGDADAARDITQDTFIRAFTRLADFRGESAFGSWLHTIAFSVGMNAVRTAKRRESREGPIGDGVAVAAVGRRAEPDLRDRLAEAIDGLPDRYRTVFVMHDVEGYTHEEIGVALGIASGTSKAQLFRARAKLRVELAEFRGEWAS